jgi:hypothetical protein
MEWWVPVVPALVVLDVLLFAALQSRPGGTVGPILWDVGPPVLAGVGCGLLLIALVASLRKRSTFNRWSLAGCAGIALVMLSIPVFYGRYPSSHDRAPSPVSFLLPLDGPVRIAWGGGPSREVNYHAVLPDERWAYDLLVTKDGKSFQGEGKRVEDYYCYNRPVIAPAAGRVEEAHDGEPDTPIGSRGPIIGSLGNYVVIEVAPREFLVVAHLLRGSLAIQRGDRVAAGQALGRVGNSGHSSEPHVHVHLQDRAAASLLAEGIPLYFSNYLEAGRLVERGMPEGGIWHGRFVGQTVQQAPR